MNTLRMQVTKAVRQGRPVFGFAETSGVNEHSLYRWLTRFADGGQQGLQSKPKSGRPAKLTEDELRWIAQTVRDETPQKPLYRAWQQGPERGGGDFPTDPGRGAASRGDDLFRR